MSRCTTSPCAGVSRCRRNCRNWRLFGDAEESVYAHYNHEIRKNMSAGQRIAELEAELAALREKAGQTTASPVVDEAPGRSSWRRWLPPGLR